MPVRYDNYVKEPHKEMDYTPEMIKEIIRCKDDILYFAKNYIKITTNDRGVVLFDDPYPFQIDLLEKFVNNRFSINLVARQSGKSTIVGIFAIWFACFHSDKNIGIASNKEQSAKSFLSRIKYMYELLPEWIKPGVIKWAEKSVEFDNRTKIQVAATSKDSFRGEPMSLLLLDEFAFVEPSWKADEFWASNYPTISGSKTSKVIIISTPNGMNNQFYRLFTDAQVGKNSFVWAKYDWTAVPWRDEVWAKEQKDILGEIKWNQEFGIEFLGSSSTVISANCLESLLKKKLPTVTYEMNDKFRIYEKPVNGGKYILGVDVAKGTGSDFSVIQVLKVESIEPIKLKQVAVYECNTIDPYKFASLVNRLCYYYNNGHLMIENNGEGSVIVNQIWWEFENESLVNTGGKIKDLGIRATTKTKPAAVIFMKKLIEGGMLEINDNDTITQLTDFEDLGNNRFACSNMHDDLISALYWGCYGLELNIYDTKYQFQEDEEEEEDGWGIISDTSMEKEDWSWVAGR